MSVGCCASSKMDQKCCFDQLSVNQRDAFLTQLNLNAPSLQKCLTILGQKGEALSPFRQWLIQEVWRAVQSGKSDFSNFEHSFENLSSQIDWLKKNYQGGGQCFIHILMKIEAVRLRTALGLEDQKFNFLRASGKKEWKVEEIIKRIDDMRKNLSPDSMNEFWEIASREEIERSLQKLIDAAWKNNQQNEDWDWSQMHMQIAKWSNHSSLTTPLLSTSPISHSLSPLTIIETGVASPEERWTDAAYSYKAL